MVENELKPNVIMRFQRCYSALDVYLFFGGGGLYRAAPTAYGSSQARGQIGVAAVSLHHSHSNTRSKPRLQPTPQLMATPDS